VLDIAHGHTLDGALRSALSVIAASQGNSDPGETLGKFV
jgi:hypothetical protein